LRVHIVDGVIQVWRPELEAFRKRREARDREQLTARASDHRGAKRVVVQRRPFAGPQWGFDREQLTARLEELRRSRDAVRAAAVRGLAAGGPLATLTSLSVAAAPLRVDSRPHAAEIARNLKAIQFRQVHRIAWVGIHCYNTTFSPDGRHF